MASLLLSFAVVAPEGPLAPQGWASYLLYPASIVWLVPTRVLLVRDRAPRSGTANTRRLPPR